MTNGRLTIPIAYLAQGGRNDSRGGGTRPWGPSRKRVPKYLKGPKTTYTTIAFAENSQKEVKRSHFVIHSVPPGPSQEMELMGPGGEGPSRYHPPPPPGFSSHDLALPLATPVALLNKLGNPGIA